MASQQQEWKEANLAMLRGDIKPYEAYKAKYLKGEFVGVDFSPFSSELERHKEMLKASREHFKGNSKLWKEYCKKYGIK